MFFCKLRSVPEIKFKFKMGIPSPKKELLIDVGTEITTLILVIHPLSIYIGTGTYGRIGDKSITLNLLWLHVPF